jgi:GNAT superfamily N-acetyltransferase
VTLAVRRVAGTDPVAVALAGAMVEEVGRLYDKGLTAGPSAHPSELSPPGGGFVVLYEDERAVAGGGVKRLADEVGEIKRMYVVPAARGRGLARILLGALEDLARDLGYRVVRLDTGASQAPALGLYPSAGYVSIPDYNGNPYASYWGEKRL